MDKKIVTRYSTKQIPAMHTLLVQERIENCDKITISLLDGSAEIFGIQLMKDYPHSYSLPCSLPVFSWNSAHIKIEWTQYQNSENSEKEWEDITAASGKTESAPMIQYLEYHYKMVGLRKIALEQIKEGPRIAIVGKESLVPQNVARLLLNYGGKFSMNTNYIDIDPESTIFVNGSIGVLQFEYKICEDLYDRPDKLCFYYGNRMPRSKSYFQQLKTLIDVVSKKIAKQIKEYKSQGSDEQYPFFSNGLIIQCPRIKDSKSEIDQFKTIQKAIEICKATHVISVGCPTFLTYLSQHDVKIETLKGLPLEGAERFFDLPSNHTRSKISRYFDKQSKKKSIKIDDVKLYELMTETESSPFCCRQIKVREEAISKSTVAILHAKIGEEQKEDLVKIAQKAIVSPICCLAHIFQINDKENEIILEVGQESFLEDFKDNIWLTSVSVQ